MLAYTLRRAALGLLTIFVVSSALFFFIRMAPGDAADAIIAQEAANNQLDPDRLRREFGLDKPVIVQFGEYWAGVSRGDFGKSLFRREPVTGPTLSRAGVSLVLAAMAAVVGITLGVTAGMLTALRRNSFIDVGIRGGATLMLAVPVFWLALLAVILPSKYLQWTPAGTFVPLKDDPVAGVQALIIPAIVLGIPMGAVLTRYVRTEMLNVLDNDYVRTARAKGLAPRVVVSRHVLRNALIPVLSVVGLAIPALVGGAVVIERIFTIPGLGNYLLTAVTRRDYPALQAANMLVAALVVLTNFTIDVAYGLVDPRIRQARN